MKPIFKNANLLIVHVFDRCVKLLDELHISSAQGRSVDLSVEIATGRRRMIDIISNRHHLKSWSSGSSAIWHIIS